jgi:hypothetical protein
VIEGFGFEQADLDANRTGRLTDRQVDRIRRELVRRVKILAPLLLVGPAVIAAVIAIVSLAGDEALAITAGPALVILYLLSLFVIGPVAAIGLYSNYVRPIRSRAVTSRSGPIKLISRGDDVHLQLGPRLNGVRFALDQDQADALVAGETYTIYFTPGGKRSVFHSIDHTPPTTGANDTPPTDDES